MNQFNNRAKKEALFFLRQELAYYKWYSNLLPVLAAVVQIALSVVLMLFPRIVLDAVQAEVRFCDFVRNLMFAGAVFTAFTLVNMFLQNEITKISQTFLYRRLNALWEKKMLSMNFEALFSGEGKLKIEKARQLISDPNWGIVDFLSSEEAILEALLGLLVYSLVVGKLHVLMLLFLCVLFLAELFIGLKMEKKKQSYKEERARADRRMNYMAYGTKGIKEAKDIRVYAMIPMLREITNMVVQKKCKVESDVQKWQMFHMLVTAVMILIRDGIGYLFLLYLFLHTQMTIGEFAMYFTAISGIGIWLTKIADALSGYQEVSGYVSDFYEFMDLPEDEKKTEEYKFQIPISFEFQNVHYSYRILNEDGEQVIPVIKDLNLSVKAGEKIAVVGVNGAGKSTLMKLLCGMLTPDEGVIRANGKDISEIQKRSYYSNFSAVFQHSKFLPVSIAENIMLKKAGQGGKNSDSQQAVSAGLLLSEEEKRMWEVLQNVGLEEKVKALPEQERTPLVKKVTGGVEFSGGQEQRLLLARALYKDAAVLILDEPTAALDPISENEIYQKYHALTRGKTSFFVSHRLASTRFCDRIIFLENGRITEMGTHEELMEKNGAYADMFRVQSKYYAEETGAI